MIRKISPQHFCHSKNASYLRTVNSIFNYPYTIGRINMSEELYHQQHIECVVFRVQQVIIVNDVCY